MTEFTKLDKNIDGFSLTELMAGMAVAAILLLISTTNGNHLRGSSLTRSARVLQQELERAQLMAFAENRSVQMTFTDLNFRIDSEPEPIELGGIEIEAAFGIFDQAAFFSELGTASPGRITLRNKEGASCSLTVSARGVVTNNCLPKAKP